MQKPTDVCKATIGRRFGQYVFFGYGLLTIYSDTAFSGKKVGLVDLRKLLADQCSNVGIEFLCPSTLEVEHALIVDTKGFGELRGCHTNSL